MDYDTINNIRDTILYRNDNEKKATHFTIDENIELFELACQKYGYKLWNGNAWHNNTCEQICPFGDYCSKHTVEINEERLCQGQVFSRKIDWNACSSAHLTACCVFIITHYIGKATGIFRFPLFYSFRRKNPAADAAGHCSFTVIPDTWPQRPPFWCIR